MPNANRINPWIPVGIEGDDGDCLFYTIYDLQEWLKRDVTDEEWSTFEKLLRDDVDNKYGVGALRNAARNIEPQVIEIHWEEAFPYEMRYYWWEFRDHFFSIVGRLLTTEKNNWIYKNTSPDTEDLNSRIEKIFGGDREARIRDYNISGLITFIEGYQNFKKKNDENLMEFMLKNINDSLKDDFGYDGEEITNNNIGF